jgi:hypothetical protein
MIKLKTPQVFLRSLIEKDISRLVKIYAELKDSKDFAEFLPEDLTSGSRFYKLNKLKDNCSYLFSVIKKDISEVIGWCFITWSKEGKNWDTACIDELYLDPDHIGRVLGLR